MSFTFVRITEARERLLEKISAFISSCRATTFEDRITAFHDWIDSLSKTEKVLLGTLWVGQHIYFFRLLAKFGLSRLLVLHPATAWLFVLGNALDISLFMSRFLAKVKGGDKMEVSS